MPELTYEKHPNFGVIVQLHNGVDLSIDAQEELRRLYSTEYLLIFRNLEMTYQEQRTLARYLGPLLDDDGKQFVSNVREDGILGTKELLWHSDIIFAPVLYAGLGLYALDVKPGKTSTRFANAVRAAATLPIELRQAAMDRKAVHFHTLSPALQEPSAMHEVLWSHPETGDLILLVDEGHTAYVEGMDETESAALLKALRDHLYAPQNTYEHWWELHDFLVWDNRAIQHARGPMQHDEVGNRTLRRVVLGTLSIEDQFPGFVSSYNSLPPK